MKNFLAISLIASLCLSTVGCKDYLDVVPQNVGSLENAFRNRNEAEKYLFTCYSAMQRRSNPMIDPWFVTGGELLLPEEYNGLLNYSLPALHLIKGDVQNIDNPMLNYWEGRQNATSYYEAIRQCNTFLENVDRPIDLSDSEKERWIAEATFLKAYYHFFLAKMYGPIPLMRTNVPVTASTEETRPQREPMDVVINYVVELIDEAAPNLPAQIADPETEMGRVTRVIALSLKAEALVALASPLFNGNPEYAGILNKDGTPLFSQTADNTLWTRAAEACKEAIDLAELLGMGLYEYARPPIVPEGLTDSIMQELAFRTSITEEWDKNKELIWAVNGVFPEQHHMFPILIDGTNLANGTATVVSPFAVTNLFYSKNGVPIDEDPSWDYANRFEFKTGDDDHRYYLKKGYETIQNHFNREMRYYATFGFDGGIWYGNGKYNQDDLYAIEAKGRKSPSGVRDPAAGNLFGIYPKKLCNYLTVRNKEGFSVSNYRLPLMRMAGLYLLYAECLNEANGPSEEVYRYVDMIRARAGLEGVVDSWTKYTNNPTKPSTKAGMREIIQRERRIELCLEGDAGWDLRRWRKFVEAASTPLQGWFYKGETSKEYYRLVSYYAPTASLRDYLWPIRRQELLVNKNLVQNPFW